MLEIIKEDNPTIFICIGTSNLMGDCLGPLVGTYLKSKFINKLYKSVEIYGDIKNQVNFNNINDVLKLIDEKYQNKCTKILIDSALGENIGTVVINSGELYIGKGLNRNKKVIGDINIKCVVGKNHKDVTKNIYELKSKKFDEINGMAVSIVNSINL